MAAVLVAVNCGLVTVPVNTPAPWTDKVVPGVEVPMPKLPAFVILILSVRVDRESLIIPRVNEPRVEEAYQCLRSAPALVSDKTRLGVLEAETWSLPKGVDVPIPTLRLVVSMKKSLAPVMEEPLSQYVT